MPGVRKVLCPIDFSETSRAALAWALELSRRFDAELTLFHVYQAPGFSMPDGAVIGGPDLLADVAREVDASMADWQAEAERMGGTVPQVATALGAAQPEIVRYAADNGIDLIVIGTHGRTGLTHVLLGSTAEKVVRHARCAVLTVRAPAVAP